MSLIDAPLAFLDRVLSRRTPAVQPDDPVARMIARTTSRLRPQREYRRRLRGRVVNQYVAVREGLVVEPERRAEMGRLGRAVLYASFALAVTVSAVGFASGGTLPGDALYAVKLEIEQVRMEIAPPSVRPGLAALALEARLSEVEALASLGRWDRVNDAMAGVDRATAQLAQYAATITGSELAELARHTQRLTELLAVAPAAARPGLERALAASSQGFIGPADGQANNGTNSGSSNPASSGQAGKGGQGPTSTKSPRATASPTAGPSPTPAPVPTPKATPRGQSSPTVVPSAGASGDLQGKSSN